jgi:hypothetical protein
MYILIDHDQCTHAGAYSNLCLAKTMQHPLGHERYCLAQIFDDGQEAITLVLREEGEELVRVFASEEEMNMWAPEGALALS